jgi:hypothetical protein
MVRRIASNPYSHWRTKSSLIWLLGVIAADAVGWWGRGYVFEVYWQAYQDLGRVVNENYLLSYGNAYEMLHHIAFGAIAAFMPPVGDPTGEQSR